MSCKICRHTYIFNLKDDNMVEHFVIASVNEVVIQ